MFIVLDPPALVNEFLKNRFNNSLESIGIEKIFDIDQKLVLETWNGSS